MKREIHICSHKYLSRKILRMWEGVLNFIQRRKKVSRFVNGILVKLSSLVYLKYDLFDKFDLPTSVEEHITSTMLAIIISLSSQYL